ncbi:MAG: hypothetical protein KF765_12225 [Parvibaculaceae bacterium]|nr:hypothetical protein [Parvibaculaceae bacterium]
MTDKRPGEGGRYIKKGGKRVLAEQTKEAQAAPVKPAAPEPETAAAPVKAPAKEK